MKATVAVATIFCAMAFVVYGAALVLTSNQRRGVAWCQAHGFHSGTYYPTEGLYKCWSLGDNVFSEDGGKR